MFFFLQLGNEMVDYKKKKNRKHSSVDYSNLQELNFDFMYYLSVTFMTWHLITTETFINRVRY